MKILVIRLKHIGDALISLPVCKSLKQSIPDCRVDYMVYEHIAPLFLHHPAVDNVVVITPEERRNRWKYFQKMRAIRQARYDMVIDLLTVPITAWITRFSGARWRVGFDKGKWRSKLYNTRVKYPSTGGSLEAKLAIFQGMTFPVRIDRHYDVVITAKERDDMRARMLAAGIPAEVPVLLFSPISRLGLKNWPEAYFVDLIDYCLAQYGAHAVMIWGPDEREAVHALANRLAQRERVVTSLQTSDVRELAVLSSCCNLFIGNDSGPRHIAEAVDTPTFTIFSPAVSKFAWLPNQSDRHRGVDMCDVFDIDESAWHERVSEFERDAYRCYKMLTPELVISRLQPMLERYAR